MLGRVRTGGAIAFIGSTGAQKEKLTVVISLASHRIAGVDAIYFNDELLTLDGSGYVVAVNRREQFTLTGASAALPIWYYLQYKH